MLVATLGLIAEMLSTQKFILLVRGTYRNVSRLAGRSGTWFCIVQDMQFRYVAQCDMTFYLIESPRRVVDKVVRGSFRVKVVGPLSNILKGFRAILGGFHKAVKRPERSL